MQTVAVLEVGIGKSIHESRVADEAGPEIRALDDIVAEDSFSEGRRSSRTWLAISTS